MFSPSTLRVVTFGPYQIFLKIRQHRSVKNESLSISALGIMVEVLTDFVPEIQLITPLVLIHLLNTKSYTHYTPNLVQYFIKPKSPLSIFPLPRPEAHLT